FLVECQPRRLPFLAIGLEPEPRQVLPDRFDEPLLAACGVGVVDPQEEAPAGLAGQQPVVQRGAQVADVQPPGGRGREAGGDRHVRRLAAAYWPNKRTEPFSPRISIPFAGVRSTATAPFIAVTIASSSGSSIRPQLARGNSCSVTRRESSKNHTHDSCTHPESTSTPVSSIRAVIACGRSISRPPAPATRYSPASATRSVIGVPEGWGGGTAAGERSAAGAAVEVAGDGAACSACSGARCPQAASAAASSGAAKARVRATCATRITSAWR